MNKYDTMQVCNGWGHVITLYYDSQPQHRQSYCDKCGGSTTFICSHCNEKIRGKYHIAGWLIAENIPAPLNCHRCGKPYPWRKKRLLINGSKFIISPAKYIIDSVVGVFKK